MEETRHARSTHRADRGVARPRVRVHDMLVDGLPISGSNLYKHATYSCSLFSTCLIHFKYGDRVGYGMP
jgi:hypothetical protein